MKIDGCCPECGGSIWDAHRDLPTSGQAITALVLGCVTAVGCVTLGPVSILTGIPAVIFGEIAMRQAKGGSHGGSTRGFGTAGRIMGAIGIIGGLAVIVALIIGAII